MQLLRSRPTARRSFAALIAFALLAATFSSACDDNPRPPEVSANNINNSENNADVVENDAFSVDEQGIQARWDGRLTVTVPVRSKLDKAQTITGTLRAVDLDGNVLGSAQGSMALEGSAQGALTFTELVVEAELADGASMNVVLDWELESGTAQAYGRRSLFGTIQHDQILLLSSDTFFAGSTANVRLIAQDASTRSVLAERPATITLTGPEGQTLRAEGITDEAGTLALPLTIPADAQGEWALLAAIDTRTGPLTMEASVAMRRESRVLVTTDKPFYQPGQTIHVRVLAMRRPALIPEAGEPVTIEIQDAKGNKLARQSAETDEFGVASTKLKLAREVNLGSFRIAATVGDTTSERTVTVDRYALPKFSVGLETDRPYYKPGESMHGTVRSGYFFGKPVAGGAVTIQAWKFDLEFEQFAQLDGTLDANGDWDFDLNLPGFFVGQPLEQGDAFVRLDISVTDLAGHTQTVTRNVAVSQRDLLLQVVPAADIVPGVDLDLFALVADPSGRPAAVGGTLKIGDALAPFTTDARGIARVTIPGAAVTARALTVRAEAAREGGEPVSREFVLGAQAGYDHALAVRADQALYRAGDTAQLAIHATPAIQRVFLDVLKDNQIVLSDAADVEGGIARVDLDLPGDLVGNLQFEAYAVAPDGNIIRSHALVFVEAAADLSLTVTPDRDLYAPGETAQLGIEVKDVEGQGVRASVGLMVVDEAVFAIQDFRPGMEKVYFQLEQEILTPRYEIHGHSAEDVLRTDPDTTEAERDEVAELVFASSAGMSAYGVNLDSWTREQQVAQSLAARRQQADGEALLERLRTLTGDSGTSEDVTAAVENLQGGVFDPWGNAYLLTFDGWANLTVAGRGPDERAGTADDFTTTLFLEWICCFGNNAGGNGDGNNWNNDFPQDGNANNANNASNNAANNASNNGGDGGEQPRVRSFFPETLYVNPSILTDGSGQASVDVPLADSITTWRVTATASSQDGGLGSFLGGILVFQDFFVDINFPATLTASDEVTVPIALYNYLDVEQTVELRVDEAGDPWYELLDGGTRTVTLAPGEVRGERFTVRVTRPGWHDFQVTALGTTLSDAVRRRVQVVPDGQEQFIDYSTRLADSQSFDVDYPGEAIEGALGLQVKVYPGVLSQAIEGLDSILRMPSGCFEQTSSTTYPNILVLQYLKASDQLNPEVELRALDYITQGYQRLLTFEVDGGGFEWFGQTPAHRILTAYGLLEFTDMAEVAYVDPAVIQRTQGWLLSQQEANGSWKAAPEGIHEGATNNFTDSDLRATAYITIALLESGVEGSQIEQALSYIRANSTGLNDTYSMALAANALLLADPNDSTGQQLAAAIDQRKQSDPTADTAWWTSDSMSFTYGSGSAMDIETTTWALFALHRAGGFANTLQQGTNWLISGKDQFGTWENTQATILTLRFLLESAGSGPQEANASVRVYHDDALVQTLTIDPTNSDLLRQIDLNDRAHPGLNNVRVELGEGSTGSFLLQVTGRYWRPWTEVPDAPTGPLAITVEYDKTQLETDEIATATTTVTNLTSARLDMILIDLGIPPGFEVLREDFDAYIAEGQIARIETTGRQILVYLYGLDGDASRTFSYRLRAGEPMRAQSPPSQARLYYEESQRADSEPQMFEVNEGG